MQDLQSTGVLVWGAGTLIRIMDLSGDAHSPQEIQVLAAWLVHYLQKLPPPCLLCLSTSTGYMSE